MKHKNKGFTLIELLVVIAIIGILSAIVLASLSTSRAKANDARIQSQISSIRAAAEIFYSAHGNTYDDSAVSGASVCDPTASGVLTESSGLTGLFNSANYSDGNAPRCSVGTNFWVAWHKLVSVSGKYFCVDNTGKAEVVTASTPISLASCP